MVMLKQRATRKTALTKAPRTSALAQPKVFFDHFLGDICGNKRYQYLFLFKEYELTLTERKDMTRAAISPSMWKLSATRAMELVT